MMTPRKEMVVITTIDVDNVDDSNTVFLELKLHAIWKFLSKEFQIHSDTGKMVCFLHNYMKKTDVLNSVTQVRDNSTLRKYDDIICMLVSASQKIAIHKTPL